MKKIVSAMALATLVLGGASAELKLGMNYRNGINIYSGAYEGDGKAASKYYLDQLGYNSGKDSLTLTASGDIFGFKTIVQPTVNSNTLVANMVDVSAKLPVPGVDIVTIDAHGGWWADGVSNGNIRITTDASNFEGLDWEGNKPGSIFKARPNTFISNMVDFGLGVPYIAGYAKVGVALDSMALNITPVVMSDRANNLVGTSEGNDGAYSWAVDVNAKLPGLVELEAIVKGNPKWNKLKNDDGEYCGALGAGFYAMPLMVDGLKLAVGGSLGTINGDLSDLAFDLRANYKVNDALSLTTYHNFSVVKNTNGKEAGEDEQAQFGRDYWGTSNQNVKGAAEKGNSGIWNMVGVAYKLNPTITLRGSIEHQRMLDRNVADGATTGDEKYGSELRFTPAAEITAVKGASVLAGVTCAMRGIGSDDECYGEAVDWYWSIPVLFRVKM